jgi:hypothetical protein
MKRALEVGRGRGLGALGTIAGLYLVSLAALPAAAGAATSFVMPDPASPLYRSFVAVAGERLLAERDSSFAGNLHSNGDIDLDKQSSVTGNVSAAGQVKSHGAVTGSVTSGALVRPLPSLPTEAQARALASRVFEQDHTFRNAVINDVVYVAGDVHIRGSLDGTGTIIARRDIDFEEGEGEGHAPGLAPGTRLSLLAFAAIHVERSRPLRGLLLAGGSVELKGETSFAGVLIAGEQVHVGEGSQLTFLELDTTPPVLLITAPSGAIVGTTSPTLGVSYSDATSGVDPTSLHVVLDGTDLTATCQVGAAAATCAPPPLAIGTHNLGATVRDRAGNQASAGLSFQIVVVPPTVTITSPADGSLVKTPSVQVSGTATSAGAISAVSLNGQPVNLAGGQFSGAVNLTEGLNVLVAAATDVLGQVGTAAIGLVLDTTPPRLTLARPAPGALLNAATVRVTGMASDDNGVGQVEVAGQRVAVNADGSFGAQVPLVEGSNVIVARALDVAGNESDQTLTVVRFSLPQVAITSPADLSYVVATTVTVSGTVSDPTATVIVNGQPATVGGGAFIATGVPLVEGGNIVTATAVSATGHAATATINVVRDLTAPLLAFSYPQDGATVYESTITVSGLVNDIVAGTVNASQATVVVNGQPAAVANRSFVASVALVPGSNVVTAQAKDVSGNTSQASITVRLQAASSPRVAIASGGGQSGVIATQLGAPLVAALLDASGQPVAGQRLFFRVRGNNGSLDGGQRGLQTTTDAAGHAVAHFTLGSRAGAGNQVVEAFAPGFAGPAVFQETAVPDSAALIVVDSGDQQVGIPGQPAARPLVAVVTDRGYNRLEGAPVQFTVTTGLGTFANGLQTVAVPTDSDGRAITSFILDPAEGVANNGVRATVSGLAGSAAQFVLSGRAAGDPALTTISGVVLDNVNQPVPGVTLRVLNTLLTAQADAAGHFQLSSVPPGTVTLIVDGSTAQRAGAWPDLEYFVTVIPGRDNTVNMPIYLLPIDLAHGIQVSETAGGTLTLPEVPGFALEIAPGSVTFPGGSRSGVVSVTVVHADKVPMVPNFGQQPRLIVTIQPAGARFDPPARLTLPNVEGLAPGEVTEMYSFDHDLGHFVSIGPATVSDDGTVVTANPGVGVIKAGWHCCGNPSPAGTAAECPECQKCDPQSPNCIADPAQEHKLCSKGVCHNGDCVCAKPINFRQTVGVARGDVLHFEYKWDSSTGDLNDLASCSLYERVTYDAPDGDYFFPLPFSQMFKTHNPEVSS